jgi:hypothetical protein
MRSYVEGQSIGKIARSIAPRGNGLESELAKAPALLRVVYVTNCDIAYSATVQLWQFCSLPSFQNAFYIFNVQPSMCQPQQTLSEVNLTCIPSGGLLQLEAACFSCSSISVH